MQRSFLAAVLAALALGVAACGSDDEATTATSGGSDAPAATAEAPATEATQSEEYSGPEADVPHEYPEPTVEPGTEVTVGWLNPNGTQPGLVAEEQGAKEEVERLGGRFISKDGQANVDRQVSLIDELITQDVDVIVAYPSDPRALGPQIEKAKERGIPVIGISTPGTVEAKPLDGFVTNIVQGFDRAAYYNVKAVAEERPGATFATMGYSIPVPALKYYIDRIVAYGEEFGLEYMGNVDTGPTPQDAATAMSSILAKYPDVQAVLTLNDVSAQASATVAQSNGKDILIAGANGDQSAIDMIRAGQLFATFSYPWAEIGRQAIRAAYNAVLEQNLPLPETVAAVGTPVTKENAGDVEGV